MLPGPASILRTVLTLAAAAGILVHPSHECRRVARSRPAPAPPPTDPAQPKQSKRRPPVPQPVTPAAVLSSDSSFNKAGSHARPTGDAAASVEPRVTRPVPMRIEQDARVTRDVPPGRLHRPAHFAHAPPAA